MCFYVVRFATEKNKVFVVKSEYIYPDIDTNERLPLSRHALWNPGNLAAILPPPHLMMQFLSDSCKEMQPGMFYPVIVIGKSDTYDDAFKMAGTRSAKAKKLDESMFKQPRIPAKSSALNSSVFALRNRIASEALFPTQNENEEIFNDHDGGASGTSLMTAVDNTASQCNDQVNLGASGSGTSLISDGGGKTAGNKQVNLGAGGSGMSAVSDYGGTNNDDDELDFLADVDVDQLLKNCFDGYNPELSKAVDSITTEKELLYEFETPVSNSQVNLDFQQLTGVAGNLAREIIVSTTTDNESIKVPIEENIFENFDVYTQYQESSFVVDFEHAPGVRNYKIMFMMLLEQANADFQVIAATYTTAEEKANVLAAENECLLAKIGELEKQLSEKEQTLKEMEMIFVSNSRKLAKYEEHIQNAPSTSTGCPMNDFSGSSCSSVTRQVERITTSQHSLEGSTESGTKTKKAYKKAPVYHHPKDDRVPDDKAKIPEFYSNSRVPSLTAGCIMKIHEEAGCTAPNDKIFVYLCMEKAFPQQKSTHSLRGKEVIVPGDSRRRVINKLDSVIINFLYLQFVERTMSIGINEKDREYRATESRFNQFIKQFCDKEKHKKKYHDAKSRESLLSRQLQEATDEETDDQPTDGISEDDDYDN